MSVKTEILTVEDHAPVAVMIVRMLFLPVFAGNRKRQKMNMVAFLSLFLLVSCSKSQTAGTNQIESKSSVPDKITGSETSLDQQASDRAFSLLMEHWSVCDDLLVARLTNNFGGQALNNFKGHDYVEMKDVTVKITSLEITEADKLNGVEWSGYAEFHAKAGRFHFPAEIKGNSGDSGSQSSQRWDEWKMGDFLNMLPTFYLHKTNGQWGSSPYQNGDLLQFIQTTPCDQIPK